MPIPDNEITKPDEDRFGFNDRAKEIASLLKETDTPFVYGVFGPWGSGKSSMLNLIEHHLTPVIRDGQVALVRYSPWRYQQMTDVGVLYPLIREIMKATGDQNSAGAKKLLKSGWRVSKCILLVGADAAIAAGTGGKASLTQAADALKYVEQAERKSLDEALDANTRFSELFKEVLHKVSVKGGIRVVIMIDDLDRCLPDRAITLLSLLKTHLDAAGVAVVLAVDVHAIEKYLKQQYGDEELGQRFLQKIVSDAYYLPQREHHSMIMQLIELTHGLRMYWVARPPGSLRDWIVGKSSAQFLEPLQRLFPYETRAFKRAVNHVLSFAVDKFDRDAVQVITEWESLSKAMHNHLYGKLTDFQPSNLAFWGTSVGLAVGSRWPAIFLAEQPPIAPVQDLGWYSAVISRSNVAESVGVADVFKDPAIQEVLTCTKIPVAPNLAWRFARWIFGLSYK